MNPWRDGAVVLAAVLFLGGPVQAQETEPDRVRQQAQTPERIYGARLMTPAEREAYRERLRNMEPSKRAQFRQKHRRDMKQRARERGVQLVPPEGAGRRPGQGMGQGNEPQGAGPRTNGGGHGRR
jgi:hypothetical protein